MEQISVFDSHTSEYEAWFDNYPEVYESELLAIRSQFEALPENIHGIEVGLGTGRYAVPFGIKEGIEPSKNMRQIALERGIEVMDGKAEHLPYKDLHFDFVLFVTICHLANAEQALREAYRTLKLNGSVIIGFIDKESQLGNRYQEKKSSSTFYRQAHFYTVKEVKEMLKKVGFKNPVFCQTIFNDLDEIDEVEMVKDGYGEGSFVVVRAGK